MSERNFEKLQQLKTELLAEGLAVDQETRNELVGENGALTLGDYASTNGVSVDLGGDVFVNAPIEEYSPNFVSEKAPHRLIVACGRAAINGRLGEFPVDVLPVPRYHDQLLEDGSPITNIVNTHTDRARISPIIGCAIKCNFCNIPFETGYIGRKSIPNILKAAGVAMQDPDLPAQHMLISGGTPRKKDYGYERDVYGKIVEANPGVDVDIMMVPLPGLLDPQALKDAGVHGLSINLELYNKQIALDTMLSKAKASRELYLDFIEKAVEIFEEPGKVRSLLMVGIEPMEDTLKGVEELAKRGCDPVLSPFRPDSVTPMKEHKPPTAEQLIETWKRAQEITEKYRTLNGVVLGPRCIPCMHNTLTFPDGSDAYYHSKKEVA